ncbi:tyrosine-protein phosphatase non-receptor type 23-like [Physella acuta]|uniref:tyrosine-protein phosphatase non-receptor type 23-like n=1 Tax=Physella acuta TaxID=109671 RepID=UPI0027DAD818|nr:tyrosine-protein phosphatase non-receptor type 23-like [Physella acuta]
MEALPRLPMLSFELKHSPEYVEFGPALKQYIKDHYGEDPALYNKACTELEQLRQAALQVSRDFMGCTTLKKYYAQLQYLQGRFPMGEGGEAAIAFTWEDVQTGRDHVKSDIKFEQACILYNIGSLHSLLGALDTRHNAEGMKISCTHFQCAAWSFELLRNNFISSSMSTDMSFELLNFHIYLMLAQAQECILEKSIIDNRKNSITAKVAAKVVEFYKDTCNLIDQADQKQQINSRMHKEWGRRLIMKSAFYQSVTYYFLGRDAEEGEKPGECLAYFTAARDELNRAIQLAKNEVPEVIECLQFAKDVVLGKYESAKKDNDFVYHAKVPALDTLPEIKGACLVKGIPFNPADKDISGPDIFQKLVPMEAHEASSVYSEEKAKLSREVVGDIERKDAELEQFLSSLNLDMEQLTPKPDLIPENLMEKCAAMSVRTNAIKELTDSMGRVSGLATEVEISLGEIKQMIEDDNEKTEQFEKQYGKKNPSSVLPSLAEETANYQKQHEDGSQLNATLHKAMNTHINNLKILVQSPAEIQALLPPSNPTLSVEDEAIVSEIRRLLQKVNDMKEQRKTLLHQFREKIHTDDITHVLVTQEVTDKAAVFKEQLKKHDQVVGYIRQNLMAQDNILRHLTDTHAKFATIRQAFNDASTRREKMVQDLILSYEKYQDLLAKADKGVEYYKKLLDNVSRTLERCGSECKVRQEERDMLLTKFMPKAPPPSRPLAPKPGSSNAGTPSTPLNPDPGLADPSFYSLPDPGDLTNPINSTPPAALHSLPASFDGPKLKDYLPFMKARSFGPKPAAMPQKDLGPGSPGVYSNMPPFTPLDNPEPQRFPGLDPSLASVLPATLAQYLATMSAGAVSIAGGARPSHQGQGHSSPRHSPAPNANSEVPSVNQSYPATPLTQNYPLPTSAPGQYNSSQIYQHNGHMSGGNLQKFDGMNVVSSANRPILSSGADPVHQQAPHAQQFQMPAVSIGQLPQQFKPSQAPMGSGPPQQWPQNNGDPASFPSQGQFSAHQSQMPTSQNQIPSGQSSMTNTPTHSFGYTGQFNGRSNGQQVNNPYGQPQPLAAQGQSQFPSGQQQNYSNPGQSGFMGSDPHLYPSQQMGSAYPPMSSANQPNVNQTNSPHQSPSRNLRNDASKPESGVGNSYVRDEGQGPSDVSQQWQAQTTVHQQANYQGGYQHSVDKSYQTAQSSGGTFTSTALVYGQTSQPISTQSYGLSNPSTVSVQTYGQVTPLPMPVSTVSIQTYGQGNQLPMQLNKGQAQFVPGPVAFQPGLVPQNVGVPSQGPQGQQLGPVPQQTGALPQQTGALPHQLVPQSQHPASQFPAQHPQQQIHQQQQLPQQQPQLQQLHPQQPQALPQQQPQQLHQHPQPQPQQQPSIQYQQPMQIPGPYQQTGSLQMGPQPQHFGPQQLGQQQLGQQQLGQQQLGQQQLGQQQLGQQQLGQQQLGQQQLGQQQLGSQQIGPQQFGPQQLGPQQLGPQQLGQQQLGQQQLGPQKLGPQPHNHQPGLQPHHGQNQSGSQPQPFNPQQPTPYQQPPQPSGPQPHQLPLAQQPAPDHPTLYQSHPAPPNSYNQPQLQGNLQQVGPNPMANQSFPGQSLTTGQPQHYPQSHLGFHQPPPNNPAQVFQPGPQLQPQLLQPQGPYSSQPPASSHQLNVSNTPVPPVIHQSMGGIQVPLQPINAASPMRTGTPSQVLSRPPTPASQVSNNAPATPPSPSNSKMSISRQSSSLDDILSSSPNGVKDSIITPQVLTDQERQLQKEEAIKNQVMTPTTQPYTSPGALNKLLSDVETFGKFVDDLSITILGVSRLDNVWKSLLDSQDAATKKQSMAIARCYPMKNRDPDIMPYDDTRVILTTTKDDYINASWLNDLAPSCPKFITTQSPMSLTMGEFWAMVYEQGSEVLVQITSEYETGKKFPVYYPTEKDKNFEQGIMLLSLQSVKFRQHWVERIIYLKNAQTKQGRTLVHLQFKNWPVSGFPEDIGSIVHFISEVHSFYLQQRSLTKPIIVHCGFGTGRTGVFSLVYAAMQEILHGNGLIDLPGLAKRMLQKRRGILHKKEQLKCCYDAVLCFAEEYLEKRGVLVKNPHFLKKQLTRGSPKHQAMTPASDDIVLGTVDLQTIRENVGRLHIQPSYPDQKEEPAEPLNQNLSKRSLESLSSIGSLPDVVQQYGDSQNSGLGERLGSCSYSSDLSSIGLQSQQFDSVLAPAGSQIEPSSGQKSLDSSSSLPGGKAEVPGPLPVSLAQLQDPATFTMGSPDAKKKNKITKANFSQAQGSLQSGTADPSDPLGSLDPLWTLSKK